MFPASSRPILNGKKTKPELRYNIYGGTLGGPIKRNRTFFFFSYESRRLRAGSTTTLTVPTLQERLGDFSQTFNAAGALVPLHDPASTITAAGKSTRAPFPGNIIPATALDPVALRVLTYYPLPNRTPDSITGFYMGKVDHVFREADHITARYIYNSDIATAHVPYPNGDVALDTRSSLRQRGLRTNQCGQTSARNAVRRARQF